MSVNRNPCRRCGHDAGPGVPRPNSCSHPDCQPVACEDCGDSDDRYCPCWISLDGMSLADMKGLLALGDLSVDPEPGRGSR